MSSEGSDLLKGNKVLITGGAGFIGSNLCQELAERGKHVIILDDLSTGKKENIEELIGNKVEFVQGSVTDLPLLNKLFQNIDCVFHQAAIPSVPRSLENPLASNHANITGTLNVLLAAKDKKVKKVVYASSCAVYGETKVVPVTEDIPPNPQSPYAVTKLAGEYYCRVFEQVYGLPTVCLRYFNVYGLRQDPSSQYAAVIPKFISSLLEDEPPVIFGDGDQTRDFIFVDDAVAANILAAESNITGIFNIGTGQKVTINELAQVISNIMGKDIVPIHREPRPGDVKHSLAGISRARAFGYNARYSLEEGLRETIKAVKSNP
ncbi:MAG: SDR family oxidoreductase [Dehalococcoidia bacterium]|nr:MAG: SDR family oxidoreductase [Dehalococcoidia bacterium]